MQNCRQAQATEAQNLCAKRQTKALAVSKRQLVFNQRKEGGPREGSGGAVAEIMWAAAMGCNTCAKEQGFWMTGEDGGSGVTTVAHNGHSMPLEVWISVLPSSVDTIFITPADEQMT